MTGLRATSSRVIRANVRAVWRALTTPDLIKKWFFGVETESEWKVGSPIVHRGEYEGRPYVDKGVILRFEPPRRLSEESWNLVLQNLKEYLESAGPPHAPP
jgi:uncharacterized protein YndB with AHSA1/START domain